MGNKRTILSIRKGLDNHTPHGRRGVSPIPDRDLRRRCLWTQSGDGPVEGVRAILAHEQANVDDLMHGKRIRLVRLAGLLSREADLRVSSVEPFL